MTVELEKDELQKTASLPGGCSGRKTFGPGAGWDDGGRLVRWGVPIKSRSIRGSDELERFPQVSKIF